MARPDQIDRSFLRVEREGEVAVIVIDNPPSNPDSINECDRLRNAVDSVAEDDTIKAAALLPC